MHFITFISTFSASFLCQDMNSTAVHKPAASQQHTERKNIPPCSSLLWRGAVCSVTLPKVTSREAGNAPLTIPYPAVFLPNPSPEVERRAGVSRNSQGICLQYALAWKSWSLGEDFLLGEFLWETAESFGPSCSGEFCRSPFLLGNTGCIFLPNTGESRPAAEAAPAPQVTLGLALQVVYQPRPLSRH